MVIYYLTEPHVHQRVPRLADFSHVQVTGPWCHQSWGHASGIRRVKTSQLEKNNKWLRTAGLCCCEMSYIIIATTSSRIENHY